MRVSCATGLANIPNSYQMCRVFAFFYRPIRLEEALTIKIAIVLMGMAA